MTAVPWDSTGYTWDSDLAWDITNTFAVTAVHDLSTGSAIGGPARTVYGPVIGFKWDSAAVPWDDASHVWDQQTDDATTIPNRLELMPVAGFVGVGRWDSPTAPWDDTGTTWDGLAPPPYISRQQSAVASIEVDAPTPSPHGPSSGAQQLGNRRATHGASPNGSEPRARQPDKRLSTTPTIRRD